MMWSMCQVAVIVWDRPLLHCGLSGLPQVPHPLELDRVDWIKPRGERQVSPW